MKKIIVFLSIVLFAAPLGAQEEMPGLQVGARAPDFVEVNYLGEKVRLSDYYADGPMVLVFYRGGWCPYCTRQLKSYQDNITEFNEMGVNIVAVSVDTPENAAETVEEHDIGFEIISDPSSDTLHTYDLVYYVSDETNKKYLEEYDINLEAASGRTDQLIAIPATYVIDENGTIIYGYANEDYKVRAGVEEVLEFLKSHLDQN